MLLHSIVLTYADVCTIAHDLITFFRYYLFVLTGRFHPETNILSKVPSFHVTENTNNYTYKLNNLDKWYVRDDKW